MNDILQRLTELLEALKGADPQTSYVAKLYSKVIVLTVNNFNQTVFNLLRDVKHSREI